MGYQERNAWACGLSIIIVFVPYFWLVFSQPMAYVALFAIAVCGLIALLAGFHILNAIATAAIRKTGTTPAADELDRAIELKAAKVAGLLLSFAVVAWSIAAMIGIPAEGVQTVASASNEHAVSAADFSIAVPEVMRWIHLLFAGFVASNVVYYCAIVSGYRKLAHG